MSMTTTRGIGGAHRGTKTDTWLTPPELIGALGPFDLDPCCPSVMPWRTADRMICQPDDGLSAKWSGFVWMNPPYSRIGPWLERMAEHDNGIALLPARTDTTAFQRYVFRRAIALLFIAPRLHFMHPNGDRARANAGGPSVLVAYGLTALARLTGAGIGGRMVNLN